MSNTTDRDGAVDGDDVWFYRAYDERWREVANFREDDTSPKEEFVPHQAGYGGYGGSSYINGVVLRDKDADTAWTEASDGVLEERVYYCQNWRGDVSALVTSGREMLEWVKYLSYGVPFRLPAGDTDSDGDCDNTDIAQIQSWANTLTYDVRGDIDLDGDVDGTDVTLAQSSVLGFEALSLQGNRVGIAGMSHLNTTHSLIARVRWYSTQQGRWLSRDPLEYVDGPSLYSYVSGMPMAAVDPHGLQAGKVFEGSGSWTQSDFPGLTGISGTATVGMAGGKVWLNFEGVPLGPEQGCSVTVALNCVRVVCPPYFGKFCFDGPPIQAFTGF